ETLELEAVNPSPLTVQVVPGAIGVDRDELDVPAAFALAPGERRSLAIRFHPTRVGKKDFALAFWPCTGCPRKAVPARGEALEQAVVAEPPSLDFGQLPVDRDTAEELALHNLSTVPQA